MQQGTYRSLPPGRLRLGRGGDGGGMTFSLCGSTDRLLGGGGSQSRASCAHPFCGIWIWPI